MNNSFLEELRKRRGEMRGSIDAMELALSAPAAADLARWAERVQASLTGLSSDLSQHIEITEGPAGMYQEVLSSEPRLAGAVHRLKGEHDDIREQLDALIARTGAVHNLEDATVIRDLGTDLLRSLVHHRQRGADLVFEAYEFDVGGGET
ncbi:MAG TPA: hypothetical protein VFR87_16065 [Nocardioidaceae bacterium]|nr:hypothetical protein [Nocardioidaceae bacterium]